MKELPDAKYGENKAYESQQKIVPAVDAQALPDAPAPSEFAGQTPAPELGAALPELSAFGGPSERPGEPVTAGAPLGPGPTSVGFTPQSIPDAKRADSLAESVAADESGVIADLVTLFGRMGI